MRLGINHQSPLIYCLSTGPTAVIAGNQSPIPFDILPQYGSRRRYRWESITNPL